MWSGLVVALLCLLVALLAWRVWTRAPKSDFDPGPYNLGVYDSPYYYPHYEGRLATDWDPDSRCAAYCEQTPCTIWCR